MSNDQLNNIILEIQTLALGLSSAGEGQRLLLYTLREKAWEAITVIDQETMVEYRRRNGFPQVRRNISQPKTRFGVEDL